MESKRAHGLLFLWCGLMALAPLRGAVQEPSEAPVGVVAGRVAAPADVRLSDPVQVLLLSPEWTAYWNSRLQQRLDAYSFQFQTELAEDPALFDEIARIAHRDAVVDVIQRMEVRLEGGIAERLEAASPEGRFEFTGLPYGDYQIVAFARAGDRTLIWTESFRVSGVLPIFVEVPPRFQ